MSLWQCVCTTTPPSGARVLCCQADQVSRSYRTISPRTRILIGVGVMVYAVAGQFLSDQAEKSFGYTPTDADREKLDQVLPKIRVIDKEG